MRYIWAAYLTACASVVALADVVQLTNGRTLVGIAHEETDRWMVETRLGDLRVPKSEVRSMTAGRTPVHEYQEKVGMLDNCPTADEVFQFALWTRDQGLIRYVNFLLTRTIELDPDHPEARKMLGFVPHEGEWMTASARDALVEVQERVRQRTSKPRAETARRRRPEPEPTPYHLGIPPSLPPRGSQNQGYGGFSIWGGALPTSAPNLLNVPVVPRRLPTAN